MDAVEYLKTLQRMCRSNMACNTCTIYSVTERGCGVFSAESEKLLSTITSVENWAKEHPVRTRQGVFLEQYPNSDVHAICPQLIIKNYECYGGCQECRKHYWSQEVPE